MLFATEVVNAEWVTGNWGQAFLFDGDDAVVFSDDAVFSIRVLC